MAMNERTYLNSVLAIADLSDEMREETLARIAKIDAKNEKRKGVKTKAQKENEPIANAIIEALADGEKLSVELATAVGCSVNKVNGIALTLVNEGRLAKTKVKVKGKGEMTAYSLVVSVEENEGEGEE
jgi:hypothetical protein